MNISEVRQGFTQRRAWLTLLVLAQLFLLANGQALLGREFAPSTIIFYSFFMLWPFVLDKEFLDTILSGTATEYAVKFVVGFVLTIAVYYAVFVMALKVPPNTISYGSVWPVLAIQFFVVTPAEEIFFRGYLPRLYNPEGKSWKVYAGTSASNALWVGGFTLADVASGVTFSAFHYAAYGQNASFAFFLAFALGIIWLFVSRIRTSWLQVDGKKRPVGLAVLWGSHFAFNACALGPFVPGGVFFE